MITFLYLDIYIFFRYNTYNIYKKKEFFMKRVSLLVDAELWDRFKKIAKKENSDASKEIRKFIRNYIKNKNQLFLTLEKHNGKTSS